MSELSREFFFLTLHSFTLFIRLAFIGLVSDVATQRESCTGEQFVEQFVNALPIPGSSESTVPNRRGLVTNNGPV